MLRITVPREGGSALGVVAHALRSGGVAVIPSDTLYGFSARYDRPTAVRRIAAAKGRGETDPFLLLVASSSQLASLTPEPPPEPVSALVWPGPVTLLLPARPELPPQFRSPAGAVAVRWPADDLVLDLIRQVGVPIVSTSVNRHGAPALGDPEAIARSFGTAIDVLADAGPLEDRPPSTIVDLTRRPPVVVRKGAGAVDIERLDCLLRSGEDASDASGASGASGGRP